MYVTPCISICKIDPDTKKCQGCSRTIEQIRDWMKYSDEERMKVMKKLGYATRRKKGMRYNKTS